MKLGKELAELTAGIDQLYRSTPRSDGFLDKEGLIPVAVAEVIPAPLRDYEDATDKLLALQARLDEAESPARSAYLEEMIDSLLALILTFQEKEISYAERVRRCIRVDTQTVDEATLDGYRTIIVKSLNTLGYGGADLASDVRRWQNDARVPRDQVLPVLQDLLLEARARTQRMIFPDFDDMLEAVAIQDVPFSAYCDYPGRRLLLNLEYPYTRGALKHLACHEAFTGHLVHLGLREQYVAEGKMPLDGAQVVTSSASSALFEGIADNSIYFLDWVNTAEDELSQALMRLRGAERINAAWKLHAEGRAPQEVALEMADGSFLDRDTAESRLSFMRHGLRAPFVYAYWCGDQAVNAVWETVAPARRSEFWRFLYENMHTPTTLRTFWQ